MSINIRPVTSVIDSSPRPTREFMSDTIALTLADMVLESLSEGHPFRDLTRRERAEVCRAAHYLASLRG